MNSATEHRIGCRLMGSAFELILAHPDPEQAQALLQAGIREIERIEALLSEFREDTATAALNRNAGVKAVEVDAEVFGLVERCQRISALTQGAFDITMGPLKKIYRFNNREFRFPQKSDIEAALANVGWENIHLDAARQTVFLTRKNMRISFAAIGKGYAADRVKKLWTARGVSSGVINASGDLCTIGRRPDGAAWRIGIADPTDRKKMRLFLPVTDAAFATSGDYEQFFLYKGIKYGHTINPRTGLPVTGIKSVSILSPGAELSDALATAVYVMGADTGIHLVDQLPGTHCVVIDADNNFHFSRQLQLDHEN